MKIEATPKEIAELIRELQWKKPSITFGPAKKPEEAVIGPKEAYIVADGHKIDVSRCGSANRAISLRDFKESGVAVREE